MLRFELGFALLHLVVSGPFDGQTSVTVALNKQIAASPSFDPTGVKTYTGGKGVLMRNPYDGYETGGPYVGKGGAYKVLPSTFISNDIFASNKIFPRFSKATGFDWDSPVMVYVVGSAMEEMFKDYDSIQNQSWGWGVFYPFDSNAVDFRCEWLDPKGTPQVYDCPGYSKKFSDAHPVQDANMYGAGYFDAGNPWANNQWGGGAGCHFSALPYGCNDQKLCTNDIDQVNRYAGGDKTKNLVQDPGCQCNYIFKNDWSHWVGTLGDMTADATKGTLPEAAMCWTNNLRDMINLQNHLFWDQKWFSTGEKGSHGPTGYWGWNEIPMPRTGTGGIANPKNWDAIVIKMPVYVCKGNGGDDHLGCVTTAGLTNLETDISKWVSDGLIAPGEGNVGNRPGSYVIMMREWKDQSGNNQAYFFCGSWTSPGRKWEIIFEPMIGKDKYGACYIQKGIGFKDSHLQGPFESMTKQEAKALYRRHIASQSRNSTVVV